MARLHRRTLCYSKSSEMLELSIRLLIYYLKFHTIPVFA
ncbi:MAG: IS1 family transposase [Moorea sp. SIO4A1]|nr:IS1 family transposase [Moorena sp. SIO4A1]